MSNPNLGLKERFLAAVWANDHAGMDACLHPEFVLRQAAGHPYGGSYRGTQGFVDGIAKLTAAYEIEQLDNIYTFGSDNPDVLAFEFLFRGKVTATGKAFETTVIEHWNFRDGKIFSIAPHWFEIPG